MMELLSRIKSAEKIRFFIPVEEVYWMFLFFSFLFFSFLFFSFPLFSFILFYFIFLSPNLMYQSKVFFTVLSLPIRTREI